MSFDKRTFLLRSPFLGFLLGILFFLCQFGTAILSPAYIDWQIRDDPAQHYLGWEYFRHEPWQLPLGKINGYGAPEGSSIVYTDSIPLLALVFKAIRWSLPEPFQYTGLWILVCYALQGYFGWKLASVVVKSDVARALMACVFIVSPSMLDRVVGHHSLMGHWLLLAALYLALDWRSFESRQRPMGWYTAWALTLVTSALVHIYLLVMTLMLYGSATVSYLHRRQWRGLRHYGLPSLLAALVVAVLYVEGAFVVTGRDWAAPAFGLFPMNLLSPVVPSQSGNEAPFVSYFLTSQNWADPNRIFEGFNYLGLGAILLIASAVLVIPLRALLHLAAVRSLNWRRALAFFVPIPVTLTAAVLFLFSLSNQVHAGNKLVASFNVSDPLMHFAEIFRASGRFFWPVGYLAITWAAHGLADYYKRKPGVLVGILGLILGIQILDLSKFFDHHAAPFRKIERYQSPLKSSFWQLALQRYKHIVFYPPGDETYYIPLGLVAAPSGVSINVAYKARNNSNGKAISAQAIVQELESGTPRPDSLYVLRDRGLYDRICLQNHPEFPLLREVDGLFVVGSKRVH